MQQGRLSTVRLMTVGRADIGHETGTIAAQLKKKKAAQSPTPAVRLRASMAS